MSSKNFYSEIQRNNIKTYFLMFIFFILILVVGYCLKLIFSFAGFGILFFAGLFAIIFALVGYYSGDKIVLSTSKAKPIDEKNPKHKYLDNLVEGLAIAAGIPKPKVYVINDVSPNAFATGRDPKHSSVAVTSGLLEILNREELEGVIAHELSHIKNRDIKVMTIVTVLFGLVAMVSDIALRSLIFGGVSGNSGGNNKGNGLVIIIAVVFVILSPIIALLIQMSISRKREYLADASGAELTRYPKGLSSALRKISSIDRPVASASQGSAHLYISNPLRKRKVNLFSTHPPIEERIKRLDAM